MELKKQAISSLEIVSCCFFIKSSSIRSSRPVVTLDKPATLPLLENILTELKNWLEENLWMLKLLAMKRSIQSKWKEDKGDGEYLVSYTPKSEGPFETRRDVHVALCSSTRDRWVKWRIFSWIYSNQSGTTRLRYWDIRSSFGRF